MTMLHFKPTMRKGECQPSSIHRVLKACLETVAPWRVASVLLDFLFQREHALQTASSCSHLWDPPCLWSSVHALPGQPQPVTEHGQGTRGQSFLPNASVGFASHSEALPAHPGSCHLLCLCLSVCLSLSRWNLVKTRSYWIRIEGPKSSDWCPYKEEGTWRHTETQQEKAV